MASLTWISLPKYDMFGRLHKESASGDRKHRISLSRSLGQNLLQRNIMSSNTLSA